MEAADHGRHVAVVLVEHAQRGVGVRLGLDVHAHVGVARGADQLKELAQRGDARIVLLLRPAMQFVIGAGRVHVPDIEGPQLLQGHLVDEKGIAVDAPTLCVGGDVGIERRVVRHHDVTVLRHLHVALDGGRTALDGIGIRAERVLWPGIAAAAMGLKVKEPARTGSL